MSFVIAGIGLAAVGTGLGVHSANKAKKQAEKKAKEAEVEMNRLKNIYSQLDTSNPYSNMENVMEDLTINQAQYNLEWHQFQQIQSNVLTSLREASGSHGIASVAQSLANQGQIQAQKQSNTVAEQEQANEMRDRQEASRIQQLERKGDVWSRQAEQDKQGTLLGMSQQETAAHREQMAAADQA